MTLFDLLHESKLFNTGAEVRRYIPMQGVMDDVSGTVHRDPNHECMPERRYIVYLAGERIKLIAH